MPESHEISADDIIAELQARLETLETQVAKLEERANKVMPNEYLLRTQMLQASMIELKSPDGQTQRISMSSHETGAWITLFDGQGRARICLTTDDGAPADEDYPAQPSEFSIEFYGVNDAGKSNLALRLGLNDDNGAVEVYAADAQPAAMIKGLTGVGGVVGVVDDEGQVCAYLHRSEGGGQLELLRSPLQTGVVLHAGPQGGALALAEAGQTPRAILASMAGGAFLVLNKEDEGEGCGVKLMANDAIAVIKAHDNGSSHAASLSAMPGHGFLEVDRGPKDEKTPVFKVTSIEDNNMLEFCRPDGSSAISFQASPTTAMLVGNDVQGRNRYSLVAGDNTNGLIVIGEEGTDESVQILAGERVQLALQSANRIVAVMDSDDDCGRVAVLGPPDSDLQVAMRATADNAGISVLETDGETKLQLWGDEAGGHCTFSNAAGTPCVRLHAGEEGGSVLVMGDSGSVRAGLSVSEDRGQIAVLASGSEPMAMLNSDDHGGQLTLFDDYGDRKLTLPDDATLL